jgi:hypothetical protein
MRASKSHRETVELLLQSLITSELEWGEWSASSPGHLSPEETPPDNLWIEVWVVFRNSQDHMEKRNISWACWKPARSWLNSPVTWVAICDQYVVKVLCVFWWCLISYPTFLLPTYFFQTLVRKRSQLRVFCTCSHLNFPRSFGNKDTEYIHQFDPCVINISYLRHVPFGSKYPYPPQ